MSQGHPVARLTRAEFWACLAASLAVFLLFQGPQWRHRWQIDGSIFYSYAVVPVLVAGVLLARKKWNLAAFALGTLEITFWKFAATYVVAHTLWMFSTPPPKPSRAAEPVEPETAVVPTPIAEGATGVLEGAVSGLGNPNGAVVFVASGLEKYTFAPSASGAAYSVGSRIEPALAVAELHQDLRARSSDGRLHTLIASFEDADLFNVPLQSSGAWSSAKVRRGQGLAKLRCAVHPQSGEAGAVVVVRNPFHAEPGADGRFRWSGVPAGRVVVKALTAGGQTAEARVDVVAGRTAEAQLALGEDAKSPARDSK